MVYMLESSRSWAEITLGDIWGLCSNSAVWGKVAVVLLAVGVTRLYFGQGVPTAVRFAWPAPKVRSETYMELMFRKQNWDGKDG